MLYDAVSTQYSVVTGRCPDHLS